MRIMIGMLIGLSGLLHAGTPVLRISIVSHNEEANGPRQVDYLNNARAYLQNREYVRQLALVIKARGARWNMQSDWTFLQAVARHDTATVMASTNGKNIIRWLVEDMGFEVDPHAHETRYNYADVAYLIQQLGVTPGKTVGGFLYYPADNYQGWEQHEQGIYGVMYPAYFWRADLLWGAATERHQGPDVEAYGVWRPRDKNHFEEHSDSRRLVYIGGGCKSTPEAINSVNAFLRAWTAGRLREDEFYTATIMITQGRLSSTVIDQVAAELSRLASHVSAGLIRYQHLSEVHRDWLTVFGARPSQTTCGVMEQ